MPDIDYARALHVSYRSFGSGTIPSSPLRPRKRGPARNCGVFGVFHERIRRYVVTSGAIRVAYNDCAIRAPVSLSASRNT